jgi:hypothetical protein
MHRAQPASSPALLPNPARVGQVLRREDASWLEAWRLGVVREPTSAVVTKPVGDVAGGEGADKRADARQDLRARGSESISYDLSYNAFACY